MDSIVIMGAGPIGALVGVVAKHSGASRIIISDFDQARLEMAAKLGFDAVNSKEADLTQYVRQATNGDGADLFLNVPGPNRRFGDDYSLPHGRHDLSGRRT